MPPLLKGKSVVVTGASSGIGEAVALELARRGARVVIAARRLDRLETVAASCRALGAECLAIATDVSDRDSCTDMVRLAGTIDVLINNAGFAVFGRLDRASPDDLEAMLRTNYLGAVHCTQAVLPQMLARRSGTIVNVGSIAGIMGYAGMGGYCASKFALTGFTEALRDEVLPLGVRVALVCPGTTETEFFETAERTKMPGASRLIPALSPQRVARAVCDAAADGRYRRIVPGSAALFMKYKEIFPRLAHLMMRRVSALME